MNYHWNGTLYLYRENCLSAWIVSCGVADATAGHASLFFMLSNIALTNLIQIFVAARVSEARGSSMLLQSRAAGGVRYFLAKTERRGRATAQKHTQLPSACPHRFFLFFAIITALSRPANTSRAFFLTEKNHIHSCEQMTTASNDESDGGSSSKIFTKIQSNADDDAAAAATASAAADEEAESSAEGAERSGRNGGESLPSDESSHRASAGSINTAITSVGATAGSGMLVTSNDYSLECHGGSGSGGAPTAVVIRVDQLSTVEYDKNVPIPAQGSRVALPRSAGSLPYKPTAIKKAALWSL